jgi:hypothetical protein
VGATKFEEHRHRSFITLLSTMNLRTAMEPALLLRTSTKPPLAVLTVVKSAHSGKLPLDVRVVTSSCDLVLSQVRAACARAHLRSWHRVSAK